MQSRRAIAGSLLLVSVASAQQSAALLDAPVCAIDPRRHFETLLEINGDGYMDAVALTQGSQQIGWVLYRNDGTGQLVGYSGGAIGVSLYFQTEAHIEKCDFDQDGIDDFYIWLPSVQSSYSTVGKIWVIHDISQIESGMTYTGNLKAAKLADFNADGTLDRARVYQSQLSIDRFTPNGGGTYSTSTSSIVLGFSPSSLTLIDCNGDATPDLYCGANGQGAFVPIVGGVPQTPIPVAHGVTSMPMPAAGDVDGDGDEDLAIFGMSSYVIVRRTAPQGWSLEPQLTGGPAAKLADVDQDGDLDGICCGGGGNYDFYFSRPSTFRIALNDGGGQFAPSFNFPGSGSVEIAGAADLDHDGDVELLAGNCIYWGRGPLVAPPQTPLVGGEQSRMSLVDFDCDGDADYTPGIDGFQRNLGDGSSHAFDASFPAPPAGEHFKGPGLPGDWDGDVDVDLIVKRQSGSFVLGMRLLLNEGGGAYSDGGDAGAENFCPRSAPAGPSACFAHDLDLDGDLDLVTYIRTSTTNPNGDTLVWLNDGAGHFTFAWEHANAWPLAFGELSGGGAPDALLVPNGFATAQVFSGNGDGSFTATAKTFYMGDDVGPMSVAVEDFDLDGDDDLVGAFQFGGYGWYSGEGYFIPNVGGDLSLNDKVLLDDLDNEYNGSTPEPTPRIALAGDVNGDGLLDAVLSSPRYRRAAISIVLRKADNSGWEAPVRQVVYPAAAGYVNVEALPGALVDIDGDGDAEYVTDCIWKGLLHQQPTCGTRLQDTGGLADVNGLVPTLGATGPFRVGELTTIHVTGAPGGTAGVLVIRQPPQPYPLGGAPLLSPAFQRVVGLRPFTTSGQPGAAGVGAWNMPLNVSPAMAGTTLTYVALLADPAMSGQRVRTNVLGIEYGP